jgi:hypothetical protein
MSDPVDQLVLQVCWEAAGIITSQASKVTDRRAYRKRVATNLLEQEKERIERWHHDFDVSVGNMAQALVDGKVPQWWRGQLRVIEHPDLDSPSAEIIPFPTHLIRPAREEPCHTPSSQSSVTTPTNSTPIKSRRKRPSAT